MTELRWLAAVACGLFFLACIATSLSVALRWHRTGQTGSGLWFAGGAIAFVGIMMLPVGTPLQRLAYAGVPLFLEVTLFVALHLFARKKGGQPPAA